MVEVYWSFACFLLVACIICPCSLKTEVIRSSETSVKFYHTAQSHHFNVRTNPHFTNASYSFYSDQDISLSYYARRIIVIWDLIPSQLVPILNFANYCCKICFNIIILSAHRLSKFSSRWILRLKSLYTFIVSSTRSVGYVASIWILEQLQLKFCFPSDATSIVSKDLPLSPLSRSRIHGAVPPRPLHLRRKRDLPPARQQISPIWWNTVLIPQCS